MNPLLTQDHPYYCSESNFYSREPYQRFDTLSDFLDVFEETDVDLNLCFRWDITPIDEEDLSHGYRAKVFLILQRKGIFKCCEIESVQHEHLDRFRAYLEKHWVRMKENWAPISNEVNP